MAVSMTRVITAKGLALNAKIQAGTGDVGLPLIEAVADAGRADDLQNLEDSIDPRLSFSFESRTSIQAHAKIRILLTNQGNPYADPPIPPLDTAFSLQQINFFANDPDEGRILYEVFRFEIDPDTGTGIPYVPAASERSWSYNPTITVTIVDGGLLSINIDPQSLASLQSIWDSIEASDLDIPSDGTRIHARFVESVSSYTPYNWQSTDDPDDLDPPDPTPDP